MRSHNYDNLRYDTVLSLQQGDKVSITYIGGCIFQVSMSQILHVKCR